MKLPYLYTACVVIGCGLYRVLCWNGVTGFGIFVKMSTSVGVVLRGCFCVS